MPCSCAMRAAQGPVAVGVAACGACGRRRPVAAAGSRRAPAGAQRRQSRARRPGCGRRAATSRPRRPARARRRSAIAGCAHDAGRPAPVGACSNGCGAAAADRVAGARRGQRGLHRAPHRLVHLAAVAEAHLDLGRVHVDVDARRVDLDVQHVDRLALAVQHVLVGAARRVGEHLVAHEAAVDVGELLVGARARRVGDAGAAADAQRPGHVVDRDTLSARKSSPSTSASRCSRVPARHCSTSLPSCQIAKPTSGRASAWRRTASMQCASSVASVFRNLRRAGVLKNSSLHFDAWCRWRARRAAARRCAHRAGRRWAGRRSATAMASSETEAMAASASPRKPMVPTDSRSARLPILLVAWRRSASGSSSRGMPPPSSSTAISRTPPASRRTVTWVAPASSALSTSSRTTEAGRSTTSPAAIWLISSSGSSRMGRRPTGRSTAFTGPF